MIIDIEFNGIILAVTMYVDRSLGWKLFKMDISSADPRVILRIRNAEVMADGNSYNLVGIICPGQASLHEARNALREGIECVFVIQEISRRTECSKIGINALNIERSGLRD